MEVTDLKMRADKLCKGAIIKEGVVYEPVPVKLEGKAQFDVSGDIIWEYTIPKWW